MAFRDEKGRFHAIVIDPRLELELRRCLQDKNLALEPSRLEKLVEGLSGHCRKSNLEGRDAALLTDSSLRLPLRQTLVRSLPDLSVVAYQEVPNDLMLHPVAMLKVEEVISDAPSSGMASGFDGLGAASPGQPEEAVTVA